MNPFDEFEQWLKEHYPADRLRFGEPMRLHTTFRAGGPARYMVLPACPEEIADVIRRCREAGLPWFVMGNGSNLLVSDSGYDGVILKVGRQYSEISRNGCRIRSVPGCRPDAGVRARPFVSGRKTAARRPA